MRRLFPLLACVGAGILYLISDGVPSLVSTRTNLDLWNNVSTGFAVMLGLISLTVVHTRYMRRKETAFYSGVLLVSMYSMMAFGLYVGRSSPLYTNFFTNTAGVLEGAVLSSVCFYVVSVTYRSFKIRSLESGIMIGAAVIMMLTNTPIGGLISSAIPICVYALA